jgi:hypothetical protein
MSFGAKPNDFFEFGITRGITTFACFTCIVAAAQVSATIEVTALNEFEEFPFIAIGKQIAVTGVGIFDTSGRIHRFTHFLCFVTLLISAILNERPRIIITFFQAIIIAFIGVLRTSVDAQSLIGITCFVAACLSHAPGIIFTFPEISEDTIEGTCFTITQAGICIATDGTAIDGFFLLSFAGMADVSIAKRFLVGACCAIERIDRFAITSFVVTTILARRSAECTI